MCTPITQMGLEASVSCLSVNQGCFLSTGCLLEHLGMYHHDYSLSIYLNVVLERIEPL